MEAEMRRRLAHHVTRFREECGLTREQLAERCRISASEIEKIEAGKGQVTLMRLAVLADALGVDPLALVVALPTSSS